MWKAKECVCVRVCVDDQPLEVVLMRTLCLQFVVERQGLL